MIQTDVLIVGAGPVGLFAIFQCGMLRLKCHVVDAFETIGGQCTNLYPEKVIYDIPAHPEITGKSLIDALRSQIKSFDPVFHLGQKAQEIVQNDDGSFSIYTTANGAISAKAVILAVGAGIFVPIRPPIERLNEFEGKSVFYSVTEMGRFADKRIVVAGGGDSAIDWAIQLANICKHISLVHRRAGFRALPMSMKKIENFIDMGFISIEAPYRLRALVGSTGVLEGVDIEGQDGKVRRIPADMLLLFYGLSASLGPVGQWGLSVDGDRILVDPSSMSTSRSGIFSIGDVADYQGKLKLILAGFSEAAVAAHAAYRVVRPGERALVQHSTTTGVPNLRGPVELA